MSEHGRPLWVNFHSCVRHRSDMESEENYNMPWYRSKANAFCEHTKEDIMNCTCGEEEKDFAWVWSADKESGQAGSIVLGPECRQVNFNPEYSSGTAAVRGGDILPTGYHHYWELKMTSAVYGTNIMVGVCTPKCDMKHGIHRFCSLLGRDKESWGYSYTGTVQHAAKFRRYGPRWGKGSIIGVHLDTWRGTLEFYLNREPLGIAFTGLHNQELYPIVTSTSAHSGMKLVSSYMFPHSLQFLSSEAVFKKFFKNSDIDPEQRFLPPGLHSYILNNYWPFIKFGSKRASDDTLEYIQVRNAKRTLEEDSPHARPAKKLYSYHRQESPLPYDYQTEISADSNTVENTSRAGHTALPSTKGSLLASSASELSSEREVSHTHRCLRVLFDPNSASDDLPPPVLFVDHVHEVESASRDNEPSSSNRTLNKESSKDVD